MAKRSRTSDKGRANPSRHPPARPSIGSFDLVVRILNGQFDGPELVALYQAAYLKLLEVDPALLANAQQALHDARHDIRRVVAPE
jgi:hypothetical protein